MKANNRQKNFLPSNNSDTQNEASLKMKQLVIKEASDISGNRKKEKLRSLDQNLLRTTTCEEQLINENENGRSHTTESLPCDQVNKEFVLSGNTLLKYCPFSQLSKVPTLPGVDGVPSYELEVKSISLKQSVREKERLNELSRDVDPQYGVGNFSASPVNVSLNDMRQGMSTSVIEEGEQKSVIGKTDLFEYIKEMMSEEDQERIREIGETIESHSYGKSILQNQHQDIDIYSVPSLSTDEQIYENDCDADLEGTSNSFANESTQMIKNDKNLQLGNGGVQYFEYIPSDEDMNGEVDTEYDIAEEYKTPEQEFHSDVYSPLCSRNTNSDTLEFVYVGPDYQSDSENEDKQNEDSRDCSFMEVTETPLPSGATSDINRFMSSSFSNGSLKNKVSDNRVKEGSVNVGKNFPGGWPSVSIQLSKRSPNISIDGGNKKHDSDSILRFQEHSNIESVDSHHGCNENFRENVECFDTWTISDTGVERKTRDGRESSNIDCDVDENNFDHWSGSEFDIPLVHDKCKSLLDVSTIDDFSENRPNVEYVTTTKSGFKTQLSLSHEDEIVAENAEITEAFVPWGAFDTTDTTMGGMTYGENRCDSNGLEHWIASNLEIDERKYEPEFNTTKRNERNDSKELSFDHSPIYGYDDLIRKKRMENQLNTLSDNSLLINSQNSSQLQIREINHDVEQRGSNQLPSYTSHTNTGSSEFPTCTSKENENNYVEQAFKLLNDVTGGQWKSMRHFDSAFLLWHEKINTFRSRMLPCSSEIEEKDKKKTRKEMRDEKN